MGEEHLSTRGPFRKASFESRHTRRILSTTADRSLFFSHLMALAVGESGCVLGKPYCSELYRRSALRNTLYAFSGLIASMDFSRRAFGYLVVNSDGSS